MWVCVPISTTSIPIYKTVGPPIVVLSGRPPEFMGLGGPRPALDHSLNMALIQAAPLAKAQRLRDALPSHVMSSFRPVHPTRHPCCSAKRCTVTNA